MFKDTAMTISEEGKQYLGGAMGTVVFVEQFVQRKVEGWAKEVERLSTFAVTQPHAAYAAFTHGLVSRWNWEILSSTDLLQPLESRAAEREEGAQERQRWGPFARKACEKFGIF